VAALIILFSASWVAQIAAILMGGIAGLWRCRGAQPLSTGHIAVPVSRTVGLVALAAFFLLLAGFPWPPARPFRGFLKDDAARVPPRLA
jgi:chromate transporter